MPPPRFLTSNAAVRATTTAARMIWQSKIMTLGVACEILAVIAAILNWVTNFWWLPNAALTLATLGAVTVATKIAWDYHGRGLNAQQSNDVDGILGNVSLNETQTKEIARAIQSSGLTTRQKSDLPPALREINIVQIVEAQRAVNHAFEYLSRPGHGHVVVVHKVGIAGLDFRSVCPPQTKRECQRYHAREYGKPLDHVEMITFLSQGFINPTVLWKHPADGNFCHTNYGSVGERESPDHQLIFSFEDCVPKWRVPDCGDYVLRHDATSGSTWEQQP